MPKPGGLPWRGAKIPNWLPERFGIDRRSFGKWVEQLKKYAKIPDENIEIDERIDGGRQKIVVRRLVDGTTIEEIEPTEIVRIPEHKAAKRRRRSRKVARTKNLRR